MDAAPRPGGVAEHALVAGVGVVVAWAVLSGGGSGDGSVASAGVAAIAIASLALAAGLRGYLPLPRLDAVGATTVAGAAALTAWAGVSITWSIAGDLSWEWLARGLVYGACLVLGVLAGALLGGVRRVASLTALVVAAALGGSLLVYAAVLVALLTQSRAGLVGAAAVIILWLALSEDRLLDGTRLAVAAIPAAVVAGWAFTRPALVDDGVLRAERVADGRTFAVLAL